MAHFAEIDNNNIVVRVIVVDNSDILDSEGNESEDIGKDFCAKLYNNNPDNWVQTSYNNSFRGRFAGIGMLYNLTKDVFEYVNQGGE